MPLTRIKSLGITDGTIVNADINASAAIATSKFGAGSVLQVVTNTRATALTTTSTSFVDSGLSASITPSSASNKILILVNLNTCTTTSNNGDAGGMQILRGATSIFNDSWFMFNNGTVGLQANAGSFNYYDSPATTSSTTYKVQVKCRTNSMDINANGAGGSIASLTLLEIAA